MTKMTASANAARHSTGRPQFHCQAILFDLDGTLADTVPDLAVAVDRMLLDLGLRPAGEARVRSWVGNGATRLLQRALHDADASAIPIEQALSLFLKHYGYEFAVRSRLYPEVAATLRQLAARGLRLAVCTNKPAKFVRPLLAHFGIEPLFSAIVAGDDLPRKKPDPAPLRHLADQLKVSIAACLMVGDSRNDVEAARAAGMPVAAVSYGYNYGENIRDSNPDLVIDAFGDLANLIALG
jgi:phosphoglycolate phosphatase